MPTTGSTKPFKTYEEQIDLLCARGLIVNSRPAACEILKRMNYYRLSAYSLTLRKDDTFYPGVTLEDILALYDFDFEIREIVMRYSSIVESTSRSYFAYYHAKKYGPLGYLNNQYFDDEYIHANFLKELFININRSSDVFVIHHRENRDAIYPIWVAIEETTFGMLSKFYKNMCLGDRKMIAKEYYGLPREYVENFLQCASVARNIAAHGGRFYNRIKLSPRVKMPDKMSFIANDRPAAYFYAIYALLPDTEKYNMLFAISRAFSKHPFAMPKHLGLTTDWEQRFESCDK